MIGATPTLYCNPITRHKKILRRLIFLHPAVHTIHKRIVHILERRTHVQYGKVEICGINTSELKVLGEKEKMDLLRKAQAGDKQARDALICGNLRLVLSVIQRFAGRGESH